MNNAEVETLKKAVARGNVVWMKDNECLKVTKIENYEPEPSECAFLSVGYVALYNCELSEFKRVLSITPKKGEK